ITARLHPSLHKVIAAIPEEDWVPIAYFIEGAAVAETTYRPFARGRKAKAVRLIVRRVPPTPGSQLALYTEWSYHAFITNRDAGAHEPLGTQGHPAPALALALGRGVLRCPSPAARRRARHLTTDSLCGPLRLKVLGFSAPRWRG